MKKRLLAVALAASMTVSLLPASALAANGVAKVGDTTYETLEQAISEADAGSTVQLQGACQLDQKIPIDKSLTLDLNGQTITSTGEAFHVTDGTVTIRDSKGKGAITSNNTANLIVVDKGELVVNSGNLKNNWYVIYVRQEGKVTINGGTLTSNVASAVSTNGSAEGSEQYSGKAVIDVKGGNLVSKNDVTIYLPAGTLNISGGNITGRTAVYCKAGTTTITGGQITGKGAVADYSHSNNGCNATGDAIVVEACNYPNGNPAVEISGANTIVNSEQGKAIGSYAYGTDPVTGETNKPKTLEVTGGTFTSKGASDDSIKAYVPDNAGLTQNEVGELVNESDPVAKIGDKSFATLRAAVAAAKNDDIVILQKDVTDGSGVIVDGTEERNLTIDFNNKTYTVTNTFAGSAGTQTQCFQLLKGSTITMKNGTIVADARGLAIIIQNYSNLTLDNMVLDANTGTNSVTYTMSNNFGNSTVTGNTQIIAKEGETAFDVWYGLSETYKKGVSLTFDNKFTGRVEGRAEYGAQSQDADWQKKTTLKIEKGTFDCNFVSSTGTGTTLEGANIQVAGGTFKESMTDFLVKGLNAELVKKGAETPFSYYTDVATAQEDATVEDTINDLSTPKDPTKTYIQVKVDYADSKSAVVTYDVDADTKLFTLPEEPVCEGYTFKGWENGGKTYEAGKPTTVTSGMTFTAKWVKQVKVTFKFNDNQTDPVETTYDINKDINLLPAPTFAKHEFEGWKLEETGVIY